MTSLWCHHADFPGQWVPGHGYDHVVHQAFSSPAQLRDVIE
jgi:hypothetical protein